MTAGWFRDGDGTRHYDPGSDTGQEQGGAVTVTPPAADVPYMLRAALRKVASILALSSADNGAERDRAALYAVLVGWGDMLDTIADCWGWTPEQVREIRAMRAAVRTAQDGPSLTDLEDGNYPLNDTAGEP